MVAGPSKSGLKTGPNRTLKHYTLWLIGCHPQTLSSSWRSCVGGRREVEGEGGQCQGLPAAVVKVIIKNLTIVVRIKKLVSKRYDKTYLWPVRGMRSPESS